VGVPEKAAISLPLSIRYYGVMGLSMTGNKDQRCAVCTRPLRRL